MVPSEEEREKGVMCRRVALSGSVFACFLVCLTKNEEGLGRILRNHWEEEKIKK